MANDINMDYQIYLSNCKITGTIPEPRMFFYQNIGLRLVAKALGLDENQFITDIAVTYMQEKENIEKEQRSGVYNTNISKQYNGQPVTRINTGSPCGNCGGGQIR